MDSDGQIYQHISYTNCNVGNGVFLVLHIRDKLNYFEILVKPQQIQSFAFFLNIPAEYNIP